MKNVETKPMARILRAALSALLLLLAACAQRESSLASEGGIPAHLREIMEAGRAAALPSFHPEFDELSSALLTQGLASEEDALIAGRQLPFERAPGQGYREIISSAHLDNYITREEMVEELTFFFDFLKYAYAGYQYFGGDESFLPLRDLMIESVEASESPRQVSWYLNNILVSGMRRMIADDHFQLHNITIGARPHAARMSEEYVLRREAGGYVVEIEGALYRLIEARLRDGRVVEGALPTLTRDGEPAYAFGVFSADDDWSARALSVALENVATGERVSRVVSLSIILSYMADSYPLYEERRENGVPIVVNRTLDGSLIDSVASSSFYRRGADLRDEPVVVLDLRSHRGGFEAPMLNWMDGFGRNSPSGRAFAFFGLLSRSNYMGSDFLPPLWNRVSSRAPIARPSVGNALLVVLMDRNTGSAGDLLIGYLREMENVLFVGTNTRGLLVTREVMRTRLPISGIDFIYGTMLSLRPDFSQFEGVGFLPDLWAPPRESLDRVLAFIERYGLAKYE